ncbi:MAG: hypothetical protein ACE5IC_00090 [Candidatus Brocadiales bacterium]
MAPFAGIIVCGLFFCLDYPRFFKEEPHKERILCEEERKRLLAQCKDPSYGIVLTTLNTDMHLRENLDLTWENVDCINGFITAGQGKSGSAHFLPT